MPRSRKLDEETWGERLHRAYRQCRARTGLVYMQHAEAISAFVPISDQTLMRSELLEEVPARPNKRQVMFLTLLAYGFEPEEFGLTEETCSLTGFDMKRVRRELDPDRRVKSAVRASVIANTGSRRATASSRCSVHHDCGLPQGHAPVSAGQGGQRAA